MSDRNVIARFYVDQITRRAYNPDHVEVVLKAAGRGEQNKTWAQYTPSGTLTMQINNPAAAQTFLENLGRDFELTFRVLDEGQFPSEHASTPLPAAS